MILLIDDDQGIIDALSRYMAAMFPGECLALRHTSADDAIEAIYAHNPEAVFIDHELGTGTGLDVVQHFRGSGITFFSISGGMDAAAEATYTALNIELLGKTNPRLLAEKVGHILDPSHT